MGEQVVEEDRHVTVDHDTMAKAHALVSVQKKVAGVVVIAAAVVVELAGRQVTDIVAAALG